MNAAPLGAPKVFVEQFVALCALMRHACFDADDDEPLTLSFPGGSGRWGIRRSTFREQGLPHELLVLTDLSRTLREEERRAWQRLVRVLGHADRTVHLFDGRVVEDRIAA